MGWGIIGKAASGVAHTVTHAAKSVAHAAEGAATSVAKESTNIASAAASEASDISNTLEHAGIDATQAVADGASWAGDKFEEGAEKVEEGAVAAGRFLSDHACSIAIGTALGADVASISTDGEEEGMMAALAVAVAVAKKTGEVAEVQAAATTVANGLADAVWAVPGISGHDGKSTAAVILKYSIVMTIKEKTSEIEVSGGQYLTGIFLTVLTGFICSGELPGGFKVWEGEGSKFDIIN